MSVVSASNDLADSELRTILLEQQLQRNRDSLDHYSYNSSYSRQINSNPINLPYASPSQANKVIIQMSEGINLLLSSLLTGRSIEKSSIST